MVCINVKLEATPKLIKKHMAQLIPFAELTGGTEAVSIAVIKGKTYMSI